MTELPVRKWTQDYKEFLESLIKPEDKNQKALLVDYKEFHTGANVHFQLHPVEGAVPETEPAQLLAKFKLTSKITLSRHPASICKIEQSINALGITLAKDCDS